MVFRILLFKLFNKIETWEMLQDEFGPLTYAGYSFKRFDKVLGRAMSRGNRSTRRRTSCLPVARLDSSGNTSNHLTLIERMIAGDLPARHRRGRVDGGRPST